MLVNQLLDIQEPWCCSGTFVSIWEHWCHPGALMLIWDPCCCSGSLTAVLRALYQVSVPVPVQVSSFSSSVNFFSCLFSFTQSPFPMVIYLYYLDSLYQKKTFCYLYKCDSFCSVFSIQCCDVIGIVWYY